VEQKLFDAICANRDAARGASNRLCRIASSLNELRLMPHITDELLDIAEYLEAASQRVVSAHSQELSETLRNNEEMSHNLLALALNVCEDRAELNKFKKENAT
jgi:hypothetical protein